jgi:Ca2+-binding EF-hand superfamily protein
MSLFNPRTGIDEKIQFYFRLFDVNEDKKIDKEDLNKIMKMLFGSKLQHDEMETLGDKIFAEVIQSSEKDFLDQDDVQKILWSTNIEHKCSMHFF